MNFLYEFRNEVMSVLQMCTKKIDLYPSEFKGTALQYIEKYDIFSDKFNKNCLSIILPFWFGKAFGADKEICISLSIGNVFGLFYFLIQDEIMDCPESKSKGHLIPLANLFYLDFIEEYHKLFYSDILFSQYMKKYINEWAKSVVKEKAKVFNDCEYGFIAHKASPLKLSHTSICLLVNNHAAIEPLSKSIDLTVINFQLLDDYTDWNEDKEIGNCTIFISKVMEYCKLDDIYKLEERHVYNALIFGNIFEDLLEIAEKNLDFIKNKAEYKIQYLIDYNEFLLGSFYSIKDTICKKKETLLEGGFSDLLNKTELLKTY